MQDVVDVILQLGQFAMVVIAVWVAIIVLISIIDGHPRDHDSRDDRDPR